ncbi:hypothetical protein DPMN_069931 [Dreissena polymorpha]|uniref:Uncharacterized protein n=1 Tax=Dreissena polymorpha TaxID=45954 RepID=A0A9D4BVA9_DREPO|nr:hypothetical protein DPMN_069931 [Dreissena polymorpha]
MLVLYVFHSVEQKEIKHIFWDGQQRDSSTVGLESEVAFLGELAEISIFQLCWNVFSFPYLHKSGYSSSTLVSTSAFSASAGMLI